MTFIDLLETQERAKSIRCLATEFTPCSESQKRRLETSQGVDEIRNSLFNRLKDTVPNSRFVKMVQMERPTGASIGVITPNQIPKAPVLLGKEVESVSALLVQMQLTQAQRDILWNATMSQSFSKYWAEQKLGRITASVSKRIFTRARTLMSNSSADPTAIVKLITEPDTYCNEGMKYGMSTEVIAKRKFEQVMKQDKHKQYKQSDCGLAIHPVKPYLGASPDLLVYCKCHGEGLCEIKCPWTIAIKGENITTQNYDHLEEYNNSIRLSRKDDYYYQIQHQLAITGRSHCYFFVYTPKDYFLEKIEFDGTLWGEMEQKFDFLWTNYVAPRLLNLSDSGRSQEVDAQRALNFHGYAKPANEGVKSQGTPIQSTLKRKAPCSRTATKVKPQLTDPRLPLVYLCSLCGEACPDKPTKDSEMSIQCVRCQEWAHFECVPELPEQPETVDWLCGPCEMLKHQKK